MKTRMTRQCIFFIIHFTFFICCALHAQQTPIKNVLEIPATTYSNPTPLIEAAIDTVQTKPSASVTVNPAANVTYEAGAKITLRPGFRAKDGSTFRARIGLSYASLTRPTETNGIPYGLTLFSNPNNGGIPDLVLINLGLDPKLDHSGNTQVQNLQQTTRTYKYDDNNQLTSAPERNFTLDEEGNIKSQ